MLPYDSLHDDRESPDGSPTEGPDEAPASHGRAPVVGETPRARYRDVGALGRGGMGEVLRVHDRWMRRYLAMKVLPLDLRDSPTARSQFLHEARMTASLQHPVVPPVHDMGDLQDGRPWFTMKQVRGRTLSEVIRELHRDVSEPRLTLRRVIEVLLRACDGVAYAHSRGVIHRDLKPDNLMVGRFGEVYVMDWGLATHVGEGQVSRPRYEGEDRALAGADFHPRDTVLLRASADETPTETDSVVGTLAYMPPEQAGMTAHEVAQPSDVYALGAVLYEIMTGRPPYSGPPNAIWTALAEGPPPPVTSFGASDLRPAELCEICTRAMRRDPSARYADAGELSRRLGEWLDGTLRRDRALKVVAAADAAWPAIERRRLEAQQLRRRANELLGPIKPYDPVASKAPAWELQDRAAVLEREAAVREVAWQQQLRSALEEIPELPEAQVRLADYYRRELEAFEAAGDADAVARAEVLLRTHDRGRHAAFLRGDATLTVTTDPPGASVGLAKYALTERHLVLGPERPLGTTPIRECVLPAGSYLLVLRMDGRHSVRYPVALSRGQGWTAVRPGSEEPHPIWLPPEGTLEDDDVYIPAGPFVCGGDSSATEGLARSVPWVDGFVLRRFPVTQAEYLAFLNALVAEGRDTEARLRAPKEPLGRSTSAMRWLVGDDGRYALDPEHGDLEAQAKWPVALVDWHDARAYAPWWAETTGLPWRLPSEIEWEKAARGVDGRPLPWGDFFDHTFARVVDSHQGDPGPASVHSHPIDESPHGVRGMAGNVRDWCMELWLRDGPPMSDGLLRLAPADSGDPGYRSVRGGAWTAVAERVRMASRFAAKPADRFRGQGFRLARSLP